MVNLLRKRYRDNYVEEKNRKKDKFKSRHFKKKEKPEIECNNLKSPLCVTQIEKNKNERETETFFFIFKKDFEGIRIDDYIKKNENNIKKKVNGKINKKKNGVLEDNLMIGRHDHICKKLKGLLNIGLDKNQNEKFFKKAKKKIFHERVKSENKGEIKQMERNNQNSQRRIKSLECCKNRILVKKSLSLENVLFKYKKEDFWYKLLKFNFVTNNKRKKNSKTCIN